MSGSGDFLREGAELPMGRRVRGMGAWSPLREWSQLPLRVSRSALEQRLTGSGPGCRKVKERVKAAGKEELGKTKRAVVGGGGR